MSALSIGALRARLTLEQFTDVVDDAGDFARTWTGLANIRGAIERREAQRQFEAGGEDVRATHRIRIRWRPDVVAGMRLRQGVRAYVIHAAVDADDRRRFMICLCEETVR